MSHRMPREKSPEELKQITLMVPESWEPRFEAVRLVLGAPGMRLKRADVLRTLLLRGLEVVEAEHPEKRRRG